MLTYIRIVYSYIKLLYYVRQTDYKIVEHDEDLADFFVNTIENCGSMAIKCIQWILPRFQLSNPNSIIAKKFEKFYNNCRVHELEYTKSIYKLSFNENLTDIYDIIEIIGSGSVGQVYKVKEKDTNNYFALKVSHPNLKTEFSIFQIFFKLIIKYIDYKKYIPVENIDYFIESIHNQIDLRNEYENCNRIRELYKENPKIIIPKIIKHSESVLIMNYVESKSIDKIESEYSIYNILSLLLIFTNNNCLYGISHGDLHKGNWGISNNKLVIYDFGFCFELNIEEYKLIDNLLTSDYKVDIIQTFINYYTDTKPNMSKLVSNYKEVFQPDIKTLLKNIVDYFIENEIYISSSCLNGLIIFLQSSSYYDKINILSKDSNNSSYIINILSMCNANNMCPKLIKYMESKIKTQPIKSSMSNDFSKFNSLKKFM
jgi:predicted unusual protein kinase regulating ubiquinone biosynthesis (AarF/ABC1/UbiB family)